MFLGAGVVISGVMGMLWFSPILFGNAWLGYVFPGKTAEQVGIEESKAFSTSVIGHGLMMVLLHYIFV